MLIGALQLRVSLGNEGERLQHLQTSIPKTAKEVDKRTSPESLIMTKKHNDF